jgi:hypothetical protein
MVGYIRAQEMLASQENFRGVLHRVNAIDASTQIETIPPVPNS